MSDDTEIQVLVVGAGVGGLALAAFLRKAGLDPIVVERAETVADGGGPVELWPDTMTMLSWLDVAETIREDGVTAASWSLVGPDGTVFDRLDSDGEFGLVAVEYSRLRDRLLGTLPEESVRTGTAVQSVTNGNRSAAAEFDTGVREQFDLVVGADGLHSRIRPVVGLDDPVFQGTTTYTFRVPPSASRPGASEVWTPDGGVFRSVVTRDGERGWGWLTLPAALAGQPPFDLAATLQRTLDVEWLELDSWTATNVVARDDFRVDPGDWVEGHVALLGDAAHVHHSLTGIGTTLAIEDAATLADELTGSTAPIPTRLEAYARRRRARLGQLRGGDESGSSSDCVDSLQDGSHLPHDGVDSPLVDDCSRAVAVRCRRLAAGFRDDRLESSIESPLTP